MKKVMTFVMTLVMALSLVACKTVPEAEQKAAPTAAPETIEGELASYKRAEFEKYNSPAEENGLEGDMIYIEGETSTIMESEGMLMTTVVDGDKNAWFCVFAYEDEGYEVNLDKVQELSKKDVVLMGYYVGFSEDMQMPSIMCYETKVKDTGVTYTLLDLMTETDTATESPSPKNDPTAKPADNYTTAQINALKQAQSYLKYSSFSYNGLIAQLEYEKYSHEDAVFAVDRCGADWNEQALKQAESYLKYSAFSYQGLIDQLKYEEFTDEQAKYGADNCGADWSEQAVKCAKSYLDYSSFSKDSLIEQLEHEGFTHEQAVYGAAQNGY